MLDSYWECSIRVQHSNDIQLNMTCAPSNQNNAVFNKHAIEHNPDHTPYRLYHMLMNWKRATHKTRERHATRTDNHKSEESHRPGTHGVLRILLLDITVPIQIDLLNVLVLNGLLGELVSSLSQKSRLLGT